MQEMVDPKACAFTRVPDAVILRDWRERLLTFHTVEDTGTVLVMVPSGKPGVIRKIAELSRDDARELARSILDMLGEQDQ